MLIRFRRAGLVWPTAFSVVGVVVLAGLGTWQMQRKQWKEGLIAKIAARVGATPIPLAEALRTWRQDGEVEYRHVVARGRFHHDKERYLYAPATSGLGWHVYTPLEVAPQQFVWINRGFVADARKAPQTRMAGQLPGEVEVRGLVRTPAHKGFFTPANDVAHNLWYWPDSAAMTESAFAGERMEAAPFVIDADALPAMPGGLPQGGVTRIELPNRHLEYALTWYGLGLTLIGVYVAFAAGRLRQTRVP